MATFVVVNPKIPFTPAKVVCPVPPFAIATVPVTFAAFPVILPDGAT